MKNINYRIYFPKILIGLYILFALIKLSHAADCNELIRLGIHNVYKSVDKHDSLATAYHHLCYENYESANTDRKKSMNASFSFLKYKLGFGLGGESSLTQTTQTKICEDKKIYNELNSYNSIESQQIYDGALNAWQNCLTMEQRGLKIDIRPTPTFSAISFDLHWTGSYAAEFLGLEQPDLGKAVCNVTSNKKRITTTVKAGPRTKFPLTTKAATFVCKRLMKTSHDGIKYSEATRLTIKTSDGSFDIDMPPLGLRQVSIAEMNNLYETMDTYKSDLSKVNKKITFSRIMENKRFQNQDAQIKSLIEVNKFTLAGTCPDGWVDGGPIGVISFPTEIQKLDIGLGGHFADTWWWVHPHLCKRPN